MEKSNCGSYSDCSSLKSKINEKVEADDVYILKSNNVTKNISNENEVKMLKSEGGKSKEIPTAYYDQNMPAAKKLSQVEIERKMCEFKTLNIDAILSDLGVEKINLIPTYFTQKILRKQKPFSNFTNTANLFPLEWFDDNESDGWNRYVEYPLTGKAFLPVDDNNNSTNDSTEDYFKWQIVDVCDYNQISRKWLVRKTATTPRGKSYWVSRIYLMLLTDNLQEFAHRISRAQKNRKLCEDALKLNVILDAIPLMDFIEPSKKIQQHLRSQFIASFNIGWIEIFEKEYITLYQKDLLRMDIQHLKLEHPKLFDILPSVQVTRDGFWQHNKVVATWPFSELRTKIHFNWLFCADQISKLMIDLEVIYNEIKTLELIPKQFQASQTFDEFLNICKHTLSQTLNYLREGWTWKIVQKTRTHLDALGKGWFDLNVADWHVYRVSKLSRLIVLIKLKMQVFLCEYVEATILSFVDLLCQPFAQGPSIDENFQWPDDLIVSPFKAECPLFSFDLIFNDNNRQFDYSLDIVVIQQEILKHFENVVLSLHTIDQVEPFLIRNLVFARNVKLSSTGLLDPKISKQKKRLAECLTSSLILLNAYLEKYKKYQKLRMLDISEYIKSIKSENKSTNEVKTEISFQLQKIVELENSLPDSIVIGPFIIKTSTLKQNLINKRKEMYNKLLVFLCDVFHEKISIVYDEYDAIYMRLCERLASIEQLEFNKLWMEEIPTSLREVDQRVRKIVQEYEVLDRFNHPLPNALFKVKWNCLAFPKKIHDKIDELNELYPLITDKFRRQQVNDEAELNKTIDSLTAAVEIYVQKSDLLEMVNITKKLNDLWKSIEDAHKKGKLLNTRQEYFEQEEIELAGLEMLMGRLEPFKLFWNTAQEFTEFMEKWYKIPINELNMDKLEKSLQQRKLIFEGLAGDLVGSAVSSGIEKFQKDILQAESHLSILRMFKEPRWTVNKWNALIERSGMLIKYNQNLTFHQLLIKGFMKYVDLVGTIMEEDSLPEMSESEQ